MPTRRTTGTTRIEAVVHLILRSIVQSALADCARRLEEDEVDTHGPPSTHGPHMGCRRLVSPAPRDYNLLMLARSRNRRKPSLPGTWKLEDAQARLGEVVRKAQTEGPQRLTVHGKDAAVVLSAGDYAKAAPHKTKGLTGAVLVEVMQEARRLGLKIKPLRNYPKMRPPLTFE